MSPRQRTTPRKVLLLDGHSLAYRAFFALPETLATTSGQVTNAVYGFTSMLIKLLGDTKPDGVAVCFDRGKPAFRLERYQEYKANRRETPDAFSQQLPLIREVLESLRIPIIEVEGYEADDLLATLAKQAGADDKVVVVSGDRDVLQLVDDKVEVMMTRRGITDIATYDAAAVAERYGVSPVQWTDFVALKGETSDNLPGVPGVGDKTAAKLIQAYGDIEGVIASAGDLKPKIRSGVTELADQIRINKELGRLLTDVELEVGLDDISLEGWEDEQVRALFTSLEFRSLYERLRELDLQQSAAAAAPVEVTLEPLRKGEEPEDTAAVSWDRSWMALATSSERAKVVPMDEALDALGRWLGDERRRKHVHDAKPLVRSALSSEITVEGIECDTMIAAYLLEPGMASGYALPLLAERYLGMTLEEEKEPGRGRKQATLELGDDGGARAAHGAAATLALAPVLMERLEGRGMTALATELEFPLIGVLARMEHAGVLVDRDYLEELNDDLGSRMSHLEQAIWKRAGEEFNVNSNPQLQQVLFDKLDLPKTKKIKTGWSTDHAELLKIRDAHPIVEDLLTYREVAKLKTGFTDALLPLIDSGTARIHTTYLQASAATGRLASTNPNMQNIPIRGELGRQIRRAFVAPDGWLLLSADYSQIELRVLAHLSGDEGFLEAFASEHDFHQDIAARVYGVEPGEVQPRMRDYAKQFSYGIAYGMSAFGVSQRLGVDAEEAQSFIEAYYEQFPKVKAFLDDQVERARVDGYTTTMFGRRRYLPELGSRNYRVRAMGERMALNAPIQGSAADIIKRAMISADARLRSEPGVARMLLSVHDELVFEVPEGGVDEASGVVGEVMEGAADLRCQLRSDIHTGRNWSEAHA